MFRLKTFQDLFKRYRRPGDLVFAMFFLLFSAFMLSQIGAQTVWKNGTKLFAQPAFWPAVSLGAMTFFAFFHWIGSAVSPRIDGRWQEVWLWLRLLEFVGWFLAYVWLVPHSSYLLVTILFAICLAFRMGYRSAKWTVISAMAGFLVFKTFLQVKVPGGAIYEFLPTATRSFMPAILINTPGTAVNALTTYDGYPMTKRGQASRALSLAYSTSFFGGGFAIICLMVLSPVLAMIAPHFGSREIFLAALMGIVLVVLAHRGQVLAAGMLASFGVFISTIGLEPVKYIKRYTFDQRWLSSGFGVLMGMIPGVGEFTAQFMSYTYAQKTSKNPEKFGDGAPEGLIASEASNNAVLGAAMIPLLALGMVLGNIMEVKLRSSMARVKAPLDFIDRPIAAILFALILLIIGMHIRRLVVEHRNRLKENEIDHDMHDSQLR